MSVAGAALVKVFHRKCLLLDRESERESVRISSGQDEKLGWVSRFSIER